MRTTPEQVVKSFKRARKALMQRIGNDPEKAKAYLIEARILERCASSPSGVRLVKDLRSEG